MTPTHAALSIDDVKRLLSNGTLLDHYFVKDHDTNEIYCARCGTTKRSKHASEPCRINGG